jgi:hypothetical protein
VAIFLKIIFLPQKCGNFKKNIKIATSLKPTLQKSSSNNAEQIRHAFAVVKREAP